MHGTALGTGYGGPIYEFGVRHRGVRLPLGSLRSAPAAGEAAEAAAVHGWERTTAASPSASECRQARMRA
ncbi:hypothetical protein GCM10018793_11160 [Streptomyces sulfonofaciens]|uniref:Uncharacterized protein n=1 Tax=Streptomyces sulfonofaciens TaxID=68272 RepID=A0A919KTZ6_9ACTN|nr:hypothetical protein GCM10018793_11160 [Streptomyces sulfonofaciens]